MKDELIECLGFPKKSIVNRILAKNIITQSADLSSKEKEYLTNEIERIYILASLNEPSTNIPEFKTEQYRYEEIICLYVQLRSRAKTEQLKRMFHAIFPNPVLLIFESPENELMISACHKRLNLQDTSKVVDEQIKSTFWFRIENEFEKFISSINYRKLSFIDLFQLYNSYQSNIRLTKSIQYIGIFPEEVSNTELLINHLDKIEQLDDLIEILRKEQKKAIEFNEKMDWHMKMKIEEQKKIKEITTLKGKI